MHPTLVDPAHALRHVRSHVHMSTHVPNPQHERKIAHANITVITVLDPSSVTHPRKMLLLALGRQSSPPRKDLTAANDLDYTKLSSLEQDSPAGDL